MREFRIINSAQDKQQEDFPGDILTGERLNSLFPGPERRELDGFLGSLRRQNHRKFCVSRVEGKTTIDPNLTFFQLVDNEAKNDQPKIQFIGKGGIKGIRVYNQFAADTWGFMVFVLKAKEKNK